jgi:hypothetical protein
MIRTFTNLPFAASDLVVNTMSTLAERVAIARASPYRIDFIDAAGRVQRGPAATPPAVRITRAEKDAFEKSQVRQGTIITRGPVVSSGVGSAGATGASATGSVGVSAGAVPRARTDEDDLEQLEVYLLP